MWIHCAVVCSQVCRCTVNSSTLRAPKTDEWGQRSTVPISCSLGYVTQVLFYTLRLLRTWTWRVQLSTSPMSLFMLSSDNQYFLLAGLVCVCVFECVKSLHGLDLFQSLKVFPKAFCPICAVVQASFSPRNWCHVTDSSRQLLHEHTNTRQQQTPSSWTCPSYLSVFTCTYRRSQRPSPLANDL